MKKILVIDDDQSILEAFELMLTSAGYKVFLLAKVGDTIKKKIKDQRPDMIILDVLLSGQDGRVICKMFKADKSIKQIPIMMISAHPDAKKSALAAGADDFIEKPFEMDELLDKVKYQIS